MTPEEAYKQLTQQSNSSTITKWEQHFIKLADPTMFGWKAVVQDAEAIKLIEYKFKCEEKADALPPHEEIKKAELSHRYFKALKLAGAYAFIDSSPIVTMSHLLSAILLIEESGDSFQRILDREKAYIKLARYIADVGTDVTHADLHESLPFYSKGLAARNEMMTLATAWGYKNHVIIKKSFVDGIEFFSGETLKETDLGSIRVSYSSDMTYNYFNDSTHFDNLKSLVVQRGFHFLNHHLKNGHRANENVITGFNMVVLDVDSNCSIDLARELLKDYKYLMYTTKSHTADSNRFRIMLPTNYYLELDEDDYKSLINSLLAWLPFECDEVSNQRSRKWRTHDQSQVFENDGQLIDVLPYIPRTSRNEEFNQRQTKLENLSNLERWFAERIATGNRNVQMIKFALALVDSGMSFTEVDEQVRRFNSSLSNSLPEKELESTILQTVAKRYTNE